MQIRRAEAADEQALERVRREAILGLAVPAISLEEAQAWVALAPADRFARAIREHEVWIAVDGAAIGWVELRQDRVSALYVDPSYAGRGVGAALLAQAEQRIRGAGYSIVRLESGQNALGFYLRQGYVRCGPPDAQGAYPMRKELAGRLETGCPLLSGVGRVLVGR